MMGSSWALAATSGKEREGLVGFVKWRLVMAALLAGLMFLPGQAFAEICYEPLKTSPSQGKGSGGKRDTAQGSPEISPQHYCPPTEPEPEPEPWVPPRSSVFLSQSVPTTMVVGQYYDVSVIMRNAGTATWTLSDGYKLGSQNPTDNWTWGVNRVGVVGSVPQDGTTTFTFSVKAPTSPGTYNFQWQMVDEGEAWFGQKTANLAINVLASTVTGHVDGLSAGDISGWACSTRLNTSIDVHLYLGGPYGTGTGIGSYRADLASEAAVATACQAQGTAYRFRIPVTTDMVLNHGGKTIYVYGISPIGASNNLLANSGTFRVPSNAAPSVFLTSPTTGKVYQQGEAVTLTADASDADGNLTKVQFLVNGEVIAEDTSAPFSTSWNGNPGVYTATARAFDVFGVSATSETQFRINSRPWVILNSPSNGLIAPAPAKLQLAASAGDAEGISSVQFIVNGAVKATDSTAPYAYTWTGVPAGTYSVYAKVIDTLGGVNTSDTATVSIDSPSAVSRVYVYDQHQRLCKVIEPETGTAVMDYDAAGNMAWSAAGLNLADPSDASCAADRSAAYASGRRVDRSYDARNRLATLQFPDGRGNQAWSYTPDGLARQITTYNAPNGGEPVVNTYSYNRRRLLVGEAVEQPDWYTWSIGYGFNANGHLSLVTYPGGEQVQYAPNALGQPTQVASQLATYASGLSWYANGSLRQFTYGNGLVHTMTQNARQLPSRVTSSGGVTDLDYGYDANGNVTSILDHAQGAHYSRALQYDAADRLEAAGSPSFGGDGWHRFTYDVLDNMRSWTLAGVKDHNYYYDPSRNQLNNVNTSAGATIVGLEYDVQGNLSTRNSQGYVFDFGNRLREVTGKEAYRYDGHGRRVLAWHPSQGNILSMYGQDGVIRYQHDYRAGKIFNHIYLAGSLLATRETPIGTLNHAYRYQHTDALGSPVAITNGSGQLLERTQYDPYGAPIGKSVNGVGYTGHVMDGASGLTYMQQRYYDPQLGRFLSGDPVTAHASGDMRHFNRYAYAYNNPYKFTDPDGRSPDTLVDAGFLLWDGGNFLGAGMAWIHGKISGDESLANVGWDGMKETGGDALLSAGSLVVPGLSAPLVRGGNILENAAKGRAGEAVTRAKLGDDVAGEQVTFRTSDGTRTRADFVTKQGDVVETKTGGAQLSPGQTKLKADIDAGRQVTPVGRNATNAGLPAGQPTRMKSCTVDRPGC